MYLTKDEIFSLPLEAFKNPVTLNAAIGQRFGVSVSVDTARRIISDYLKSKG